MGVTSEQLQKHEQICGCLCLPGLCHGSPNSPPGHHWLRWTDRERPRGLRPCCSRPDSPLLRCWTSSCPEPCGVRCCWTENSPDRSGLRCCWSPVRCCRTRDHPPASHPSCPSTIRRHPTSSKKPRTCPS